MSLFEHLEKLPIFCAVCRSRSFSVAAANLSLSQPAVSRSVAELEKAVGTILLHRSRQGVRPTDRGLKLLEVAENILHLASTFEEENWTAAKPMRIGTKEPIAAHVLADFIAANHEHQFELMIRRTNTELLDLLMAGKVDLIIVPEAKLPKNVLRTVLFKNTWGLFHAPTSSASRLIVYSETLAGKGMLRDYVSIPTDAMKVQSHEIAMTLCAKGLGQAVLPRWMAKEKCARKELVESQTKLLKEVPDSKIFAVSLRSLAKLGSFRELKRFCENY
jgi:DNA-binding transcriptional LysR family regulator